ncbi:uncharacterized protein si:ch211-214j24.14 [Pygocentrus nattereri]|uniref:uncharacterized protein si:ch211-214j24.14 n=1 Tax=Pygocentrus nattereri TaxID=42514 RepID=UPI001891A28B|nr:uncharacterized protein si:ch211-214j24.14 [Pygocentrus nattereri]
MAEASASGTSTQSGAKNLDAVENALLPEDHSKNHFDIIQLQEKEVRLLGRAESVDSAEMEVQSSTLSDKELMEMRADFDASVSPVLSLEESDLEPPEVGELLMCVEEPEVEEIMDNVPLTTLTSATPLPGSPAFISAPEIILGALHYLPCPQELPPFSMKAPGPAESYMSSKSESTDEASGSQLSSDSPFEEAPLKAQLQVAAPASHSFELSVLLTGGFALMAVVVMTYVLTKK